jgi:hypothetical protein
MRYATGCEEDGGADQEEWFQGVRFFHKKNKDMRRRGAAKRGGVFSVN